MLATPSPTKFRSPRHLLIGTVEESDEALTPPLPQLACSTITLRNYDLETALHKAMELGFDTVDLGALAGLCEHVPPAGTREELRRVGSIVQSSGLAVTSVNADPGSFNDPATADTRAVLDRVRRLLEFCAENTVPRLVLTCGETEQRTRSADDQIAAVARGLNQAALAAEEFDVELVVEAPHFFRLTNTMNRSRRLLEQLSPAVGQAWDVSHVRAAGEEPAALFAEFAPKVSLIHLRDAVAGDIRRHMGGGDINFAAVFQAAAAVGFTGPFVLELETHNSPYESKEEELEAALTYLGAATQPTLNTEARR